MKEDDDRTNRWTLAFADADLERLYRAERDARWSRRYFVTGGMISILIWLGYAFVSSPIVAPDARFLWTVVVAMAIGPIASTTAIAAVMPAARFRRVAPTLVAIVVVVAGSAPAILCTHYDAHFALMTAASAALFLISVHTFVNPGFLQAVVLTTALTVLYLAVLGATGNASAFSIFWFATAQGYGIRISQSDERRRRRIFLQRRAIERERDRADALLANVLPQKIADRLKTDPSHIADGFAEVTILFADIVGFTDLSARLSPAEVVAMLNRLFTAFDDLAEKHRLEKIKTIGDAYMVVGGLPEPRDDHAIAVAEMALEMREAVARVAEQTGHPLKVRIGLNSGPVVAGVIGKKKFAYDLWGDAVNTASRMESHGVVGEIQISESTFELVKERFEVEARGAIAVKGKGEMPTWLLRGRRAAAAA